VAVICVFAKTHVSDHEQVRTRSLYRADCAWDNPIWGIVFASTRIFMLRNPKENHCRDAARREVTCFYNGLIDRELKLTGHRLNGLSDSVTVPDEERRNKVGGT
jgi:hypothetical protein